MKRWFGARGSTRSRSAEIAVALACLAGAACGESGAPGVGSAALVAVLSAMPSELAPNLADAEMTLAVDVAGRDVRMGSLGGVPVVLAMTGIGTANAAAVSSAVLDAFPVTGVIVSGVAHTSLRIADVSVIETWITPDGSEFPADRRWLEKARALEEPGGVGLPRCSEEAPGTPGSPICVDHDPQVVIGGVGHTSDPFGGAPFPCLAGGGGVFGCAPRPSADGAAASGRAAPAGPAGVAMEAQDMETAMIAREASARGLPFIAFRATSDSARDPLESLGEFFHFYGLAADTASRATRAFLERIAH